MNRRKFLGTLAGTAVAPTLLTETEKPETPETPSADDPRLAEYEKLLQAERDEILKIFVYKNEIKDKNDPEITKLRTELQEIESLKELTTLRKHYEMAIVEKARVQRLKDKMESERKSRLPFSL